MTKSKQTEPTFPLIENTIQTIEIRWPNFNFKGALGIWTRSENKNHGLYCPIKLISWGLLNSFLAFWIFSRITETGDYIWKDSSSFPKTILIQIALQSVKSEMPPDSSLWKPYKYIQRWWVPYGSDKWNRLLWISGSSLQQNTIGWIWCSWNKALIAWPNNTESSA